MGTQEVKLERAGEKSTVDNSDPVFLFILFIFILDQESSTRVTHDSHKLSDKPFDSPLHEPQRT